MTEYVCLTLLGHAGELPAAFQSRLYAFWTHILRNRPDDYAKVYSEAVAFEDDGGRPARRYMVEPAAVDALATELSAQGVAYHPVDRDDLYSKAEASSSEWFQIE